MMTINTPTTKYCGDVMAVQPEHSGTCEVEIALLKQRVEIMERDVQNLDNDIKGLRAEMKLGFEKVLDKFDAMRDEMMTSKSFGKGVYWVFGVIVAAIIAFKDQIIGLVH